MILVSEGFFALNCPKWNSKVTTVLNSSVARIYKLSVAEIWINRINPLSMNTTASGKILNLRYAFQVRKRLSLVGNFDWVKSSVPIKTSKWTSSTYHTIHTVLYTFIDIIS